MIPAGESHCAKNTVKNTVKTRGTRTQAIACKAASLALVLLGAGAMTVPALAEAGRSVLVVLDASGSMNARLPEGRRGSRRKGGRRRSCCSLAPDTRLALRVYGHQSTPDQKNCQDSELCGWLRPGERGQAALLDKAAGLKARGYTPITSRCSLQRRTLPRNRAPSALWCWLSDGRETCRADPCVAAKALAAADVKLVVHTIGLGVDAAARSQLQCIASVVRGSYFDAGSRSRARVDASARPRWRRRGSR